MNLANLSKENKAKINTHKAKINTLNSTELLQYSKDLQRLKSAIGANVCDYLYRVIEQRKMIINDSSIAKSKCKMKDMISEFDKKVKV